MRNSVLLFSLSILLLSGYASALQASYMYVSLSYGRGWWPWVCFTEKGVKGIGQPGNYCRALGCPFEDGTMLGISCFDYSRGTEDFSGCDQFLNDDLKYGECVANLTKNYSYTSPPDQIMPPAWGLVAKVTVPEDIKLVALDNSIVGDELCVGDRFRLVMGVEKGEYWQGGGHDDSPQIFWVRDVQSIVKKILDYHKKTITKREDICSQQGVEDGMIDNLTGIPIYNMPVSSYIQPEQSFGPFEPIIFAGNMVCSLKEKSNGIDTEDYYYVKEKKDINYSKDYFVECMYYYYGGSGGGYGADGWGYFYSASQGQIKRLQCPFYTLKVPTVIQYGPDANPIDYWVHNIDFQSVDDFFKVGDINYSKTIKVVDPAHASLELNAPGFDSVRYGEPNTLRIVLKNSGDADIVLRHLSSNVDYKVISCDSETITAGTQTECLLSVVPVKGRRLEIKAEYKYKSCGRIILANASLPLMDYKDITLSASSQAYGFDVYGDCRNDYFGCDAPSREGSFVVGYRCFNKDGKYNVPSIGRFDLKYDLSNVPASKEILGARLYLKAKNVNKAQTVTVYSTSDDKWQPTGCVPGGDICAQPWCKECLPLYDFAGNKEASVYVEGPGEYSLDVSDYIKGEIGKGDRYASFQLMGQEDEWGTEGEKTCADVGKWTSQEVEFNGSGVNAPYLEVVYR